jgi:hypothetical protein
LVMQGSLVGIEIDRCTKIIRGYSLDGVSTMPLLRTPPRRTRRMPNRISLQASAFEPCLPRHADGSLRRLRWIVSGRFTDSTRVYGVHDQHKPGLHVNGSVMAQQLKCPAATAGLEPGSARSRRTAIRSSPAGATKAESVPWISSSTSSKSSGKLQRQQPTSIRV